MRPSSKVWKSMLYGRWAESKPTHGEWIVQLPNDKAAPFTVLLAISHGRFNLMPDIMTRDLLVDIFSTCDFHDTTHILCPWAQAWTQLAVPSVSSTVSVVDSADQLPISDDSLGLTVPEVSQVLYIAWAMRCVAELNKLLWGLMLGESAEVLKDLISHNTQSQDQGILTMPTELLEFVISQRLALIEPLLNLFHTEVNLRMHLHPGGCQALQSQHNMRDQRTCNMVILGELWRRLHWLGRTAMPSRAPQVSESVQDIRGVLYETLVYNFETLGGHGACGPSGKHGQKLAKISDQWVDLDMLPGAFRLQVKRHRERLGFMGKRPQE